MKRLLTSLVLIPSAAYVMVWGPQWLFLLVAAALAFACFHEYAGLANGFGLAVSKFAGYGLGALLLLIPAPTFPFCRWLAFWCLPSPLSAMT